MTLKQLVRVFHQYDVELDRFEPQRFQGTYSPEESPELLNHLRWMCQEVLRFLPRHKAGEPPPDPEEAQAKLEKAMRWLGFVQGAQWAIGDKTIDELRADNTRSA